MHHIVFDAAGVKGLCHELGKKIRTNTTTTVEDKEENQLIEEGWHYIFDLKKIFSLASKKWTFDRSINTD